jgi:hypothetical protein
MPFVILPTNSASGGYDITNSLRFNFASSDNLSRTPASSGNRNTWTLSFWFKKDTNAVFRQIFNTSSTGNSNTTLGQIYFDTSDRIVFFLYTASAEQATVTTTQKFRDPSAWYHIVIAYDDTQATASNRVKFYVNGSQITAFDTTMYPSQNLSGYFNMNQPTFWGKDAQSGGSNPLSGYLSEAYFIDGQALTPTSFGETDTDTGIWKPKAFSGTYGTNGFYLQFKNSASLGTDSSGNGNTFTVNNLTSIDQTTDTPTNNFCTMNPLDNYYAGSTFTEGNTKVSTASSPYTYNTSTIKMGSGKYYIEGKWTGLGSGNSGVGIINTSSTATSDEMTAKANGSVLADNGPVYANGSYTGTNVGSFSTNDIVMIAFDGVNNAIYYGKNGTWLNSGVPTSGASKTGAFTPSSTSGLDYFIGFSDQNSGSGYSIEFNFGNPPYSANSYTDGAGYGNFSYAVPSGYYALNTKNLAQFG